MISDLLTSLYKWKWLPLKMQANTTSCTHADNTNQRNYEWDSTFMWSVRRVKSHMQLSKCTRFCCECSKHGETRVQIWLSSDSLLLLWLPGWAALGLPEAWRVGEMDDAEGQWHRHDSPPPRLGTCQESPGTLATTCVCLWFLACHLLQLDTMPAWERQVRINIIRTKVILEETTHLTLLLILLFWYLVNY